MGGFFILLYKLFRRYRLASLGLFIIMTGLAAWFASGLKLEEDINKVLPQNEKLVKFNRVFEHTRISEQLVMYITLTDSSALTDPEMLEAFANVLEDSLKARLVPDYIREIRLKVQDSLFSQVYGEFYRNIPFFLDSSDYISIDSALQENNLREIIRKDYRSLLSPASMIMKDYIMKDPLSLTSYGLKRLRSLQLDQSYSIRDSYIFSSGDKYLMMFIVPAYASSKTGENGILMEELDRIIHQTEDQFKDKVTADYFGSAAVAAGNARQIKKDIYLTVSLAAFLLIAFIFLYFRKKSSFILIFLPSVLGAGFALAILFLIGKSISAISLGFGAVLLGISVDYALHFLNHARKSGDSITALKDLSTPIIMSSLTTAGAFFTLLLVRSGAIRDLGLFSAFSVMAAALLTLTLLPQILGKKALSSGSKKSWLPFIDRLASYPFDKKRILQFIILGLTILFIFTARKISFESDMSNLSFVDKRLQKAEKTLDRINDYTLRSVYLVSTGKNMDEALRNNEQLAKQVKKLQDEGIVKKYTSVDGILLSDSLQRAKIARWNSFWTPDKKEELKKGILKEAAILGFKPDAFDAFFHDVLDHEYQTLPPSAFDKLEKMFLNQYIYPAKDFSTVATILKVKLQDKQKVYDALGEDSHTFIFDKQFLTTTFIDILKDDLNLLVWVSLLMVFAILLVAYGRIELAIITFIPMLISWIWTLGIMSLSGLQFNIFNIIISSFVFGIGIDYGIFIMNGMLHEYKFGEKKLTSFKTSILLSAITTLIGLGVLILAKHPALKSIALSAIIGISSVLFITFTLEPLLFRWLISYRGKRRVVPITFGNFAISIMTLLIFLIGSLVLTIAGFILFYLLPLKKKQKSAIFHYWLMIASRIIVYAVFTIRKTIININAEDFKKPSVIISNHQSHLGSGADDAAAS